MLLMLMHVQNFVKFHSFILKILIGNEILTSFKGHNSVLNWRQLALNNPKLDVVNINASAKFGQNPFLHSQDIEQKRNSEIIQQWKWMLNDAKLDFVNINAYAKFGQNSSKYSQDIEQNRKCYGRMDGRPQNSISPILITMIRFSIYN